MAGATMRWLDPAFRDAVRHGSLGIALTGAGSWLGRAFLALLAQEDVLPPPEKLRLFASSDRVIRLGGRSTAVERLAAATPLSDGPWLLFHFAFLGKERTGDMPVADFLAANDAILADTLRIASPASTLRFVFASSGAAHAVHADTSACDTANPYGWCKVSHERRLTDWCRERDVSLVVPRIFNIGGPFINKTASYALSSFIEAARTRGTIRIAARRRTYRSYVHINELLGLLASAALQHVVSKPLAFDTAGSDIVEMQDLAEAVRRVLQRPGVLIERASLDGDTPDKYVGDGARYRALLAERGKDIVPLDPTIADTANFLEATSGTGARTVTA